MLAQNFMSAKRIGMSDRELDAHIKVLGMLERGELVHVNDAPQGERFNMSDCGTINECGTVACIGGWVALCLGRKSQRTLVNYVHSVTGPREELYFPHFHHPVMPHKITPQQAAHALRNYLTTGKPGWAAALSKAE